MRYVRDKNDDVDRPRIGRIIGHDASLTHVLVQWERVSEGRTLTLLWERDTYAVPAASIVDVPVSKRGHITHVAQPIPCGAIVAPTDGNTYGLPVDGLLGEVIEYATLVGGADHFGRKAIRTQEIYRVEWYVSEHTTRVLTMRPDEFRWIPEG